MHNLRRFDLILIGAFGDGLSVPSLAILVSAVLVLLCGQTESQRRMIAILTQYTVGVSN